MTRSQNPESSAIYFYYGRLSVSIHDSRLKSCIMFGKVLICNDMGNVHVSKPVKSTWHAKKEIIMVSLRSNQFLNISYPFDIASEKSLLGVPAASL